MFVKREQYLGTKSVPPPNDYYIFMNIVDHFLPSYYLRKRTIQNLVDNNDITDLRENFADVGSPEEKCDF